MAGDALYVVTALLGAVALVVVVVTVVLTARGQPERTASSRRPGRPVARSMRGWQAQTIREIRRAGRRRSG